MARKTNDPFDFSKARGSSGRTAFRTPQMSKTMFTPQDRLAQKNAQRNARFPNGLQLGVSPWKALAIYAASLTRLGAKPGMTAAFTIAKNAPRGATALKLGASMVRGSIAEAETILQYKPSTMFTRGIGATPELTSAYYRSLAKILGQQLPKFPAAVQPTIGAAGQVLKNASRGLVK